MKQRVFKAHTLTKKKKRKKDSCYFKQNKLVILRQSPVALLMIGTKILSWLLRTMMHIWCHRNWIQRPLFRAIEACGDSMMIVPEWVTVASIRCIHTCTSRIIQFQQMFVVENWRNQFRLWRAELPIFLFLNLTTWHTKQKWRVLEKIQGNWRPCLQPSSPSGQ